MFRANIKAFLIFVLSIRNYFYLFVLMKVTLVVKITAQSRLDYNFSKWIFSRTTNPILMIFNFSGSFASKNDSFMSFSTFLFKIQYL